MNLRQPLPLTLFLVSLLANVAWAEDPATRRVGILTNQPFASGSPPAALADAITRRLRHSGYVLGKTFTIEKLSADAHVELLPGLATELLARKVDVIVAGSYPAAAAAKAATSTVPIVIVNAGDPVRTHLVQSLKRPGANVTGISDVAAELAPKRLEFLKDAVPRLKRVAMLWDVGDLGMTMRYEASADVAMRLGMSIQSLGVREPDDFDGAFAEMERDMPDGLLMVSDALTTLNRKRVYEFAAKHRLPAIYEIDRFVRDGGLMSYGPDPAETAERVAGLVERILKGTKPADLPLEQPTRFRLVINLKTARALGLSLPPSLLARADEIIE